MDDGEMLAALTAGDLRGLETAYRTYADRLYAYCRWMLPDDAEPGPAADALHDTFVLASQCAGQLREPARLRCWLYAIARNECLRRLEGRFRPAGQDRELAELTVRHGLPVDEISELLRVPAGRLRDRLGRLAAESAAPETGPADEPAAPFPPAPPLLWARLELHCFDPGVALEREAIVRRAGRFHPGSGFPRPLAARRRRRRAVAGLATMAVVALLAAGATALNGPDPPAGAAPRTVPTPLALPPATPDDPPEPTRTAPATPVAAITPSPTAAPAPTPTPPSALPPAPTPAPLTVEATVEVNCVAGGWLGYWLAVTAAASDALSAAELSVTTGSGTRTYPMEVDGPAATVETDWLASRELEWSVEVAGADGEPAGTGLAQLSPCA